MEDGSRIDLQDFLIVDFDLYGGNPQFPIHSFYSPRFSFRLDMIATLELPSCRYFLMVAIWRRVF
jgi:hypothetical protein